MKKGLYRYGYVYKPTILKTEIKVTSVAKLRNDVPSNELVIYRAFS